MPPHPPLPSSPSKLGRAAALAVILGAVTAPASRAFAQSSGEKAAAAQALFDEAMRLMKAGQAGDACPKLEESLRLDPGMGTQFRLAECYEKVGKVASAWASFVAVADSAAVARLPERETAARKRAEALLPKISRLTLAVPPAVAALEGVDIQRDGSPVGRPLWGVPMPVDPGEHVVTVRAPGKKPWEGRVTAAEAAGALSLAVPLLEDLPRVGPLPPPVPVRRPRSAVPAIVLGGVAAAAVGTGVAFFVVHSSRRSDAESLSQQIKLAGAKCGAAAPDMRCGTLADRASSSDLFGNLSTVAFAAGGAAAAATIGYLIWPSGGEAKAGRVRLGPAVGEGRGGVWATGSF